MPQSNIEYQTSRRATAEAGAFAANLMSQVASSGGGTFDSAASNEFVENLRSSFDDENGASNLPRDVQVILDSAGDEAGNIMRALVSGINEYERQHGVNVPPDVVELALHNGAAAFDSVTTGSAASLASDPGSLVPMSAIVSIYTTLTAAIPFAHYVPADRKSREARIGLMKNSAGTKTGRYNQGDSIDGVKSGKEYMGQIRTNKTLAADGSGKSDLTGKITKDMTARDVCDQSGDDVVLRKGRTRVLFKGRPVAVELNKDKTGSSAVGGSFSEGDTEYAVGGNINNQTGEYALTVTPIIAAGTEFVVEASLDFEANKELIPRLQTNVDIKPVFADSWTAYGSTSRESMVQMQDELGIDPHQALMIAVNAQYSNERFRALINYALRLAQSNVSSFNLDYNGRKANMSLKEMWRDLFPVISAASQAMAERTNMNGVTHAIIGPKLLPYIESLPSDLFVKSGESKRPGIYRIGRFTDGIEVYYSPDDLAETNTSAEMLLIGRAPEVARSAFIVGDVSSPVMEALGKDKSLEEGVAFHAVNFTGINPHEETLESVAMINITGLPDNS